MKSFLISALLFIALCMASCATVTTGPADVLDPIPEGHMKPGY